MVGEQLIMAKAFINGKILRWARQRASLSIEALADKAKHSVDILLAWEEGKKHPTFKQAQRLAAVIHVPFGYLFLSDPPTEGLQLPDLRTVGSDPNEQLDLNFRDLLSDVMFKHDWFVEILQREGSQQLSFVGSLEGSNDPVQIAENIRATLKVDELAANAVGNWEDYLRFLMLRAENAGIWVMRSGIVGSNTRRPLSINQFRGFAISDALAPLVFLNGRDAKAAQIFTLAHELAHIWLGKSGISNVLLGRPNYGNRKRIEVLCNKVAAEFLVPTEVFVKSWNPQATFARNLDMLTRQFKVSNVVIARRAYDLRCVSEPYYMNFYRQEETNWESQGESSGGNFYATLPVRNGPRFTREVVARAYSGQTLIREAAMLLNIRPASVTKYYRRAILG